MASYDLEEGDSSIAGYRAAAHQPGIFNAGLKAFRIDYRTKPDVHIVNGMGVTLGDSIIGLTAISALKHTFPDVKFTLYRPGRAPRYVEELYALAGHLVSARIALPFSPRDFPVGATVIDIGNHLFWPDFAALPMIDFFLGALGVEASSVTSSQKANRWLAGVPLPPLPPAWQNQPYVLFCASASTAVRSIPQRVRADLVERLVQRYDLPVLGFGPVKHARYIDVQPASTDTAHFLALIRGARCVMSGDTAAVHAAAGFDVPTIAFFTTIEPALRVRDYPACHAIELRVPQLRGIHASSQARDIVLVERAYDGLPGGTFPLPELAGSNV
ncbi:glycosyltransferase family 9 protein [Paraburkholderia saeva]|uniref:glycosyltransferase family 9 protein n=1 Tax=Paraburkholderia saeva TaxID=2777537 RepID=UPI001E4FC6A4|nr:ADP-heptose--LPS heptosyltransferase [Paraburkholderia saeva]